MARWLADADIHCAEVSGPGWQVRLLKDTGYVASNVAAVNNPVTLLNGMTSPVARTVKVAAPVAGVFLEFHPVRTSPLTRIGARVETGDCLALLQIGQLLVPVPSPADGVVTRVLVAARTTVGYGRELLEIDVRPT
jgi:acetyl-CoA carboxylase biotin carboxyl carrier protein